MKNIKKILYITYELKRDWSWYITNNQIFEMSKELIDRFIQYLANKRTYAMNIDLIYCFQRQGEPPRPITL